MAVIGAGITGVTAAYLLAQHGTTVALVERAGSARRHGLHDREAHGRPCLDLPAPRRVVRRRDRARVRGVEPAGDRRIPPSSRSAGSTATSSARATTSTPSGGARAGARARGGGCARGRHRGDLTTETDLPFPVRAAVRVDAQAQFHPWKYAAALAAATVEAGGHVLEETRATNVRAGDPCVVETPAGIHPRRARDRRDADAVPRPRALLREGPPAEVVRDRGPADDAPLGMYISVDQPMRSIRSTPGAGREAACSSSAARGTSPARADTAIATRGSSAFMRERFTRTGPSTTGRRTTTCRSTSSPTSAGCDTATIASSSRPASRSGA